MKRPFFVRAAITRSGGATFGELAESGMTSPAAVERAECASQQRPRRTGPTPGRPEDAGERTRRASYARVAASARDWPRPRPRKPRGQPCRTRHLLELLAQVQIVEPSQLLEASGRLSNEQQQLVVELSSSDSSTPIGRRGPSPCRRPRRRELVRRGLVAYPGLEVRAGFGTPTGP